MVREQIASMIEAAQGSAAEIERKARESGHASKREALGGAGNVAKSITSLERELASLLRGVSQEADGLRLKLEHARLVAGSPPPPPPSAPAIEGEATTMESKALPGGLAQARAESGEQTAWTSEVDEEVEVPSDETDAWSVQEAEPEQDVEPDESGEGVAESEVLAEPQQETAEQPQVVVEPEQDAAEPEQEVVETEQVTTGSDGGAEPELKQEYEPGVEPQATDPGSESASPDDQPGTTPRLTETEASVSDRTDFDLAELHNLANTRAAEAENDDEVDYWRGIAHATVEEAANRPEFGAPGPDERSGGRRGKKRTARVLGPLMEARDGALTTRHQDDAGAAPLAESSADNEAADVSDEIVPEAAEGQDGATAPEGDSAADAQQSVPDPETGQAEPGLLSRLTGRRGKKEPFITTPGHCTVCQKTFEAGSEDELRRSGWKVNGDVGLCPDDQAEGWELPEGAMRPARGGSRRSSTE